MPRKKKGNRNPYANKKVGKSVEYDCVIDLKEKGCWAKRQPDDQQIGESSCIDVFCWNPHLKQFWVIQCKRHRKLLLGNNQQACKLEIKAITDYATKFSAIPYLCYRDKGLHYEIIG